MLNIEGVLSGQLSESAFEEAVLRVFNLQYTNNKVYRDWVDALKINAKNVKSPGQIPFLPIEFFKSKEVVSSPVTAKSLLFTSSSTTSQIPAKHHVNDPGIYELSFLKGFEYFYGPVQDYCFLALLPNYLERRGSSLVYMCEKLMKLSDHSLSGFFLDHTKELLSRIQLLKENGQKVILIGVSYALMDLCETGVKLDDHFIVMETGGMKGKRRELLKTELHALLKDGLGVKTIHSEYGMTELLSQAYSKGEGLYTSPPWMKFLIREIEDPFSIRHDRRTGGINVIDLANIHSCSFIATKDLGNLNEKGELQLMGRYDNSDVRGCNLMLESN